MLRSRAELDDQAEELINPRPSARSFSSRAEREAVHDALLATAETASSRGQWDAALSALEEAYPITLCSSTLLQLIGLHLVRGDAELAAVCYEKLLESDGVLSLAERELAQEKQFQARNLANQVHEMVESQVKAHHGSEEHYESHMLISKAKMLLDKEKYELAAALLIAIRASELLTDEDTANSADLLAEAHEALAQRQKKGTALRPVHAASFPSTGTQSFGRTLVIDPRDANGTAPNASQVVALNVGPPASEQQKRDRVRRAQQAKNKTGVPVRQAARPFGTQSDGSDDDSTDHPEPTPKIAGAEPDYKPMLGPVARESTEPGLEEDSEDDLMLSTDHWPPESLAQSDLLEDAFSLASDAQHDQLPEMPSPSCSVSAPSTLPSLTSTPPGMMPLTGIADPPPTNLTSANAYGEEIRSEQARPETVRASDGATAEKIPNRDRSPDDSMRENIDDSDSDSDMWTGKPRVVEASYEEPELSPRFTTSLAVPIATRTFMSTSDDSTVAMTNRSQPSWWHALCRCLAPRETTAPHKAEWASFVSTGGNPEESRKAWLAHYIARHKYHEARSLVVSKEEEERVAKAFAAADTNGDGVLSEAELEAFASLAEWYEDPQRAALKTVGAAQHKTVKAAAALVPATTTAAARAGAGAAAMGGAALRATADMILPPSVKWQRWIAAGGDPEVARRAWLRHHIGWRRHYEAMALVVSEKEAAEVATAFKPADTDGDGVLSEAELAAFASFAEWKTDPKSAAAKTVTTARLKSAAVVGAAASTSAQVGTAVAKQIGSTAATAASDTATRGRLLAKRFAVAGTASGVGAGGKPIAIISASRKRDAFEAAIAHYDWHLAAELAEEGGGTFYEVACGFARVDWMARYAEAEDIAAALEMVVSDAEEEMVRAHRPGQPWVGGGSVAARRNLGFWVALREHDWEEARLLASTEPERRLIRAEEERLEWLVYEGLRARQTHDIQPALEFVVNYDEEAAVRELANGSRWNDPAHAAKAWREHSGTGLWRGRAREERLLQRVRAAFAEMAAAEGTFDSHLVAALTFRVNPMSLAARDDVLVDEKQRWKDWVVAGGNAEAARCAWLRYFVAWRQYHKAMALVVSQQEADEVAYAFRAADTNGDGVLSAAELEHFASLVEWVDDPRYAATKTAAATGHAVRGVFTAVNSLVGPSIGWYDYIARGGDPEASRRVWLEYFVARRRYDDAMTLVVNEAEAAHVAYACREADTNGDGILTRAEIDAFSRRLRDNEATAAANARDVGSLIAMGEISDPARAAMERRRRLLAFTSRRAARKLTAVCVAWLQRRRAMRLELAAAEADAAAALLQAQAARGREDAVAVLRRTAAAEAAADAAEAAAAVKMQQLQRVRLARRAAAERRAELVAASAARAATELAAQDMASQGTTGARQAQELAALAAMREEEVRAALKEDEELRRRVEAEAGEASEASSDEDPFADLHVDASDRESIADEEDRAANDSTDEFDAEYESRNELLRRKYAAADRLTRVCRGRIARRRVTELRRDRDLAASVAARAQATAAAENAAAAAAQVEAFEAAQAAEAAQAEAAAEVEAQAASAATMLQRAIRGTNARTEAARRRAAVARADADRRMLAAKERAEAAARAAAAAQDAELNALRADRALHDAEVVSNHANEAIIQSQAAAAMQALARGRAARTRAAAVATSRAGEAAAVAAAQAQAAADGRAREAECAVAATRLQSRVRGCAGRRAAAGTFAARRAREVHSAHAATILQASVRGNAARRAARAARLERTELQEYSGLLDPEEAALLIQRSWRGLAGRLRLWRELVATGQQKKVARHGGLFGIGKGKEQERGLELRTDCLIYRHKAGRKPKRIPLIDIAAAEPLDDPCRWRLRMRKGKNFEFNAGTAVGRSAWVHCVSHNMRLNAKLHWNSALDLLGISDRLSRRFSARSSPSRSPRRSVGGSSTSTLTPRSPALSTPRRSAPTSPGGVSTPGSTRRSFFRRASSRKP